MQYKLTDSSLLTIDYSHHAVDFTSMTFIAYIHCKFVSSELSHPFDYAFLDHNWIPWHYMSNLKILDFLFQMGIK